MKEKKENTMMLKDEALVMTGGQGAPDPHNPQDPPHGGVHVDAIP